MLPTARSSDTVRDVTARKYLSESPEYPPTSWKAVRARPSGDRRPATRPSSDHPGPGRTCPCFREESS